MLNIAEIISDESILFFDLDGTVIETDYANFVSYRDAIKTVKNIDLVFDPSNRFDRGYLVREYPNLYLGELDEIISIKEINYRDNLGLTAVNMEVLEVLNKYSKTHKTVLVTNCREDRARETIRYHNLENLFWHCCFRQNEDDKLNKFQNAIRNLKILPEKIIVFENDDCEIEDATKLGIHPKNIIKIKI